jgi:hypothetical protein
MKKLLLVLTVAAIAVPAASAGGWATVGLSSLPPSGLEPNQAWPVDITVLQHGQTPLAGVTPIVRIRNDGGKLVKSFAAKPTGKTGVYHAVVEFPRAGTYSYEVYDGFTQYGGARTHTFKPVRSVLRGTRSRICRSVSPWRSRSVWPRERSSTCGRPANRRPSSI